MVGAVGQVPHLESWRFARIRECLYSAGKISYPTYTEQVDEIYASLDMSLNFRSQILKVLNDGTVEVGVEISNAASPVSDVVRYLGRYNL